MKSKTNSSDEACIQARPMLLEGTEALKLYLAEIDRKLSAMKEQFSLLPTTLDEMKELLDELALCRRKLSAASNHSTRNKTSNHCV